MKPADDLRLHCRARNLPEPVAEFVFAPPRKWRFDWAWPDRKIAVEVDGIVYGADGHAKGRHVSIRGLKADLEKLGEAFALGWSVLRVLPEQVRSGHAAALAKRAMEARSRMPHPESAAEVVKARDLAKWTEVARLRTLIGHLYEFSCRCGDIFTSESAFARHIDMVHQED